MNNSRKFGRWRGADPVAEGAVGYHGSADADRGLQWAFNYAQARDMGADVICSWAT